MKIVKFLSVIFIVSGLFFLSYKYLSNFSDENKFINVPNNEEEKKSETKKEIKLTLVGDFLFESPLYKDFEENGTDEYFKYIKDIFKSDDLTIGNMEVVIGNNDLTISGDGYNFCAPKSIGELVSSLGIEVLSTANNHSYDRGFAGVKSTLDFFKSTDILTVGTKTEDKDEEKILEINGIKIGFVAYTLGTNKKVDEKYLYSISRYREPGTKSTSKYKEKIKKEVENLKTKTDIIIALMHWGNEFTYKPNDEQKDMANFLNNIGIDIIYGSHSHSIQPIEEIKKENYSLVFYSLGNFVSADDDIARTGEEFDNAYNVGLISNLTIIKNKDDVSIQDIKAYPVINYFDKNMKHFKLIPYNDYTDDLEKSHYRYNMNFNKKFIDRIYTNVIDEQYR